MHAFGIEGFFTGMFPDCVHHGISQRLNMAVGGTCRNDKIIGNGSRNTPKIHPDDVQTFSVQETLDNIFGECERVCNRFLLHLAYIFGKITRFDLNTLFIGQNFISLPEATSTNDLAWELLSSAPPEGTVLFTPHQTSGKGQQGARWYSNPGENLTFSLVLYPGFLRALHAFDLNRLASVALERTLSRFLPDADIRIKWPNDILVSGKKIAGILIRNQLQGQKIATSVIGIGLNINQTDFPEPFGSRTTSVKKLTGKTVEVEDVLQTLLKQIELIYLKLRKSDMAVLDRIYLQNLYGYQEPGRFRVDGREKEGIIIGVNRTGQLALELDGKLRYFNMKEVEFCI